MLLCYDETTKLLRRDKKLKKIISLFMAFVFTFALFGCGKAANTSEEAKKDSKDNVKEFIEMMDSVLETIASKSLPLQKETRTGTRTGTTKRASNHSQELGIFPCRGKKVQ